MKRLTSHITITLACVLLVCGTLLKADVPPPEYSDYKQLLNTYVAGEKVNYKAWADNKEDVAALKAFVKKLGQTDINSLSRTDQKALYINLPGRV